MSRRTHRIDGTDLPSVRAPCIVLGSIPEAIIESDSHDEQLNCCLHQKAQVESEEDKLATKSGTVLLITKTVTAVDPIYPVYDPISTKPHSDESTDRL